MEDKDEKNAWWAYKKGMGVLCPFRIIHDHQQKATEESADELITEPQARCLRRPEFAQNSARNYFKLRNTPYERDLIFLNVLHLHCLAEMLQLLQQVSGSMLMISQSVLWRCSLKQNETVRCNMCIIQQSYAVFCSTVSCWLFFFFFSCSWTLRIFVEQISLSSGRWTHLPAHIVKQSITNVMEDTTAGVVTKLQKRKEM